MTNQLIQQERIVINLVLIRCYLRNAIKIMNLNLLFEFEDYQAKTSAKLSYIEIQKRSIQQCKDWLAFSAIFLFFAS